MNDTPGWNRRSVSAALLAANIVPAALRAQTKAPPLVSRTGETLVLANALVRRVIALPTTARPRLTTSDYRTIAQRSRFFTGAEQVQSLEADEFGFRLGGVEYGARTRWRLVAVKPARDDRQGEGVTVSLRDEAETVEVDVRYLMYSASPIVRKTLTIRNLGTVAVALEDVDLESFALEQYHPATYGWVYSDYGRRKSLVPFAGGRQDSLVALHNPDWGEGIVLGNEAAGVNKYIGVCDGALRMRAGLARSDGEFPFRRWLQPGASYTTPAVFSTVYAATPRFETILNTVIPDFVRKHMGIRLSDYPSKPTFVYNPWEPFGKTINEALVLQLAEAAAAAGAKTFVVDDGWQDVYGDWNVDRTKFPNGLRPVMDRIKALGMKPGLWISIGSAQVRSSVSRDHPEWFARNARGQHHSVHSEFDTDLMTACMATGWRGYIGSLLDRLTREHGLEYLKLDFAVVTSPYMFDPGKTGCHAADHPGHRDHEESLSVNYDFLWSVFDTFKRAHRDVFIDCTFETMGGLQLVDYAMLQHAEGNWLSNFNASDEVNDLRIRNMAWWRSPAMPATALVIGNAKLADEGFELHLKSLAGSLPILLGDPRAMTPQKRALSRQYSDQFARLQRAHDMFSFRQDLEGFGEPSEGFWDGWQRINTDTGSGGLVGIFRHGATEARRQVTVTHLDPKRIYVVRELNGEMVSKADGASLASQGFDVEVQQRHGGRLFEVAAV